MYHHQPEAGSLDSIFFQLPDTLLVVLDHDGVIRQASQAWEEALGYPCEELCGQPFTELLHVEDREATTERLTSLIETLQTVRFSNRCCRRDGGYIGLVWSATTDRSDGLIYAAAHETALEYQSNEATLPQMYVDGLTGLPNRSLFLDRVEHTLHRSQRRQDFHFGILYVGLDRFKVINDSLGHRVGDLLLAGVSNLLKQCIRPTDMVARLGGDEFALLLEDIRDASSTIRVVSRIQEKLTLPFRLHAHEVFTSVSIGIAISGPDYSQPDQLIRDANIAMVRAKRQGGAGYVVFGKEMHDQAVRRMELEMDLRKALERDEFQAFFQPIVSLEEGRLAGFEALVRWGHPTKGLIPPIDFIPVAEETGMIVGIGRWMLHRSCLQLAEWHRRIPEEPLPTVSVNVSPKQLLHSSLVDEVREALDESGLEGRYLKLEITESAIMENAERAMALLDQLKGMGIQILLDDFGTGYSSLSYLHRLPIDILKIDRSFVRDVESDETNRSFVQTIINLAHQLKLKVICEGVEEQVQERLLREMGAEYTQGFLYSRPVAANEAEILLISDRAGGG